MMGPCVLFLRELPKKTQYIYKTIVSKALNIK